MLRKLLLAVVVAVVAALIAFSTWAANPENSQEAFRAFFLWTMGLQFVLLSIWCAFACGQAISQERQPIEEQFAFETKIETRQ